MVTEQNARAKATLASLGEKIAAIDAEMDRIVDLLVADKIAPALARVQEINLRARRENFQNMYNAVHASIKHF